uniref:Uncharacterized protein n=1 Tax=Photinus pyralis TaxID=7054 RepID=A0A1Y1MNX0_PHOPY
MDGPSSSLPPEAIELAGRMYDAARAGDLATFQQALPAGLPANLTNEKGDTLVCTEPQPYLTRKATSNQRNSSPAHACGLLRPRRISQAPYPARCGPKPPQ